MTQTARPAAPQVETPSRGPRKVRVATALGPAFVAAIAYVDPGNFATNFAGGASVGYGLLWVVLLANLTAMPIQFLAAKLGAVTGQSLPRLCRDKLRKPAAWFMWGQAEVVAMATDLAEFVGAAIGLNLLFRVPLPLAALFTAVLAFAILALQRRGHRPFELAIGGLLALICGGFLYLVVVAPPSASASVAGLVPTFSGSGTLLLAVGIIGATVMPHAIYLHSGLMSDKAAGLSRPDRLRLLHFERIDIGIAMSIAGLVNLSMLAVAAKLFHENHTGEITLESVHTGIGQMVGGAAALAFAAALLASGISSSSVGTAAGQIVMEGFLGRQIPLWLRRLITMSPAVILLCSGVDLTQALVLSQVVLSFGIPFALVALLMLTSRRDLMGSQVNTRTTVVCMSTIVVVISSLNILLLGQQIF